MNEMNVCTWSKEQNGQSRSAMPARGEQATKQIKRLNLPHLRPLTSIAQKAEAEKEDEPRAEEVK